MARVAALLALAGCWLPGVASVEPIFLGRLQIAAVIDASGPTSPAWQHVTSGLLAAQDYINALDGGDGVVFLDALGTKFSVRVNVTMYDGAGNATLHAAAVNASMAGSRRYTGAPATFNPVVLESPGEFTAAQAVIGVQPQFSITEAAQVNAAGLLHVHSCTHSKRALSAVRTLDTAFSMQPSAAAFGEMFVDALARRGVKSAGVIYSLADPLLLEACKGLPDYLEDSGLRVAFVNTYNAPAAELDVPHLWGYGSALGSTTTAPAAGGQTLLEWARGVSRTMEESDTANILHCGLSSDVEALLRQVIETANIPLDGFFSYPAPGTIGSIPPVYNATSVSGARAVSPFLQSLVPSQLGRFVTTAESWTVDARYNDTLLTDSPAFVNAFWRRTGRLPTWREASAAATVSVMMNALVRSLRQCQILYPVLYYALYSDDALYCAGVYGRGYSRWLQTMQTTTFFTVLGPVSFGSDHVNTALQPLLLQSQAADPAAASSLVDDALRQQLAIVLPSSQAQALKPAQVPSGASILTYPRARGLVHPMPGAMYLSSWAPLGQAAIGIVVLACIACFALYYFVYQHRFKTVMRKARVMAVLFTITGCLCGLVWVGALVGPATPAACGTRVALPCIAVTLLLAPVIGRAFHIRKQFDDIVAMKQWKFTQKAAVYWTAGLLVGDAAVLALYFVASRTRHYRAICISSFDGAFDFTVWGVVVGYKVVQCIAALVLLSRIRFLSARFDETHYMAIIAYHTSFVVIIGAIILFFVVERSWTLNIELLAAANPQYAFSRAVADTAFMYPSQSPHGAQLASFTVYMSFTVWTAAFSLGVFMQRKVRESLAERNALAEAAILRKRAKREAGLKIGATLAKVAPAPGAEESTFQPHEDVPVPWWLQWWHRSTACLRGKQPQDEEAGTGLIRGAAGEGSQSHADTGGGSGETRQPEATAEQRPLSAAKSRRASEAVGSLRARGMEEQVMREQDENAKLRASLVELRSQIEFLKSGIEKQIMEEVTAQMAGRGRFRLPPPPAAAAAASISSPAAVAVPTLLSVSRPRARSAETAAAAAGTLLSPTLSALPAPATSVVGESPRHPTGMRRSSLEHLRVSRRSSALRAHGLDDSFVQKLALDKEEVAAGMSAHQPPPITAAAASPTASVDTPLPGAVAASPAAAGPMPMFRRASQGWIGSPKPAPTSAVDGGAFSGGATAAISAASLPDVDGAGVDDGLQDATMRSTVPTPAAGAAASLGATPSRPPAASEAPVPLHATAGIGAAYAATTHLSPVSVTTPWRAKPDPLQGVKVPPARSAVPGQGQLFGGTVRKAIDDASESFLRNKSPLALAIKDSAKTSLEEERARTLEFYKGTVTVDAIKQGKPPVGGARPVPMHMLQATRTFTELVERQNLRSRAAVDSRPTTAASVTSTSQPAAGGDGVATATADAPASGQATPQVAATPARATTASSTTTTPPSAAVAPSPAAAGAASAAPAAVPNTARSRPPDALMFGVAAAFADTASRGPF